MDKMREEFEAWFLIASGVDVFSDRDGGAYKCEDDESTRYLCGIWLSWKASRAALCVQMPRCCNEEQDSYRLNIIDSLDDAGVSYE